MNRFRIFAIICIGISFLGISLIPTSNITGITLMFIPLIPGTLCLLKARGEGE